MALTLAVSLQAKVIGHLLCLCSNDIGHLLCLGRPNSDIGHLLCPCNLPVLPTGVSLSCERNVLF